jgi:hypothetical protein
MALALGIEVGNEVIEEIDQPVLANDAISQ